MTTHFQPGQHPDADQLNAFVEHTLPPHEQQATLAHLAVCADCRAITYLAQPSAPALLQHPTPVRTPFFARWMLAFPAAAVLACLVILTIHVRNLGVARDKAAAENQAKLEQTPPPPATPSSATPAVPAPAEPTAHTPAEKPQPKLLHVQPENNSPAKVIAPVAAKPAFAATGSAADKSTGSAGLARSAAAPQQPSFSAATYAPAPAPPDAFHAGALRSSATQYDAGYAHTNQQAAAAPSAPPPPPTSAAPASSAASNGGSGIYGGTGQSNLNENYIEGIPTSNIAQQNNNSAANAPAADQPSDQAATANDTIAVADTSAAQAAPAAAPYARAARLAPKPAPTLPSHLPAISIAVSSRHELALDSAGALFRSSDAGVTWEPITAQWTGRAVKVQYFSLPSPQALTGGLGAISTPAAKSKKDSAPPPAFQLTTDDGTTWLSPDGQTWKQK